VIHPGLVSITFRKLTAEQIVGLVRQAGLRGIEWGGDIHVPHGDLNRAREVREMTQQAGLSVAAYGSYYRVGRSEDEGLPFERVLASAVELGAPTLRVWAGTSGSAATDEAARQKIVQDLRRIASLAAATRITISLEFHGGTLTDTTESALHLLNEVGHDNLFTYWQPLLELTDAESVAGLEKLKTYLTHLHVYQWGGSFTNRQPLAEGQARWKSFLDVARSLPGEHYAMLEYVPDDSPENFLRDGATLRDWLKT
jgi:sugar phosphate isomerase/epimerase